jgi:hypothetical protein
MERDNYTNILARATEMERDNYSKSLNHSIRSYFEINAAETKFETVYEKT